jgi:hypothetical protein
MSEAMQLAGNPQAFLAGKQNVTIGEPFVADPQGWITNNNDDTLMFGGTKYFDARWIGAESRIRVEATGSSSPCRFLPFQPDRCTYMEVDSAASAVFTSQLSGCNIYVSTVNGAIWLFHANANAATGSNDANNNTKRALAQRARQRVRGMGWDLSLERGVQAFYPAGAAVGIFFGQKVGRVAGGSGWGFYLYTLDGQVHRLASNQAGTNATLPG